MLADFLEKEKRPKKNTDLYADHEKHDVMNFLGKIPGLKDKIDWH